MDFKRSASKNPGFPNRCIFLLYLEYLFEIARFESLPYEAMNLYSPDNNFAGYQANSENLIRVPNL